MLVSISLRRSIKICHYCSSASSRRRKGVFLGSDDFSIPSLSSFVSHVGGENVTVVVSNLNNVLGKAALAKGLRTCLWEDYRKKGWSEEEESYLGVVASFGFLIPEHVIQRFKWGILNVHASLLPRWRGAAPVAHAIMNGDVKTGVSIMRIAAHKFDIGPVLHMKEVPLHPHVRRKELTTILSVLGAEALSEVLQDKDFPHDVVPVPQKEEEVSFAPKLDPSCLSLVDWERMDAVRIYNRFRGLEGVCRLKTQFNEKPVDLDDVGLVVLKNGGHDKYENKKTDSLSPDLDFVKFYEGTKGHTPIHTVTKEEELGLALGEIVYKNGTLFVKCLDSDSSPNLLPYIAVKRVKVGTKWMSAKDFQNGFLSKCKGLRRFGPSVSVTSESAYCHKVLS